MRSFHLGDRVLWLPKKESGIVIDLLDYLEEDRGYIGLLKDGIRQMEQVKANECVLLTDFPNTETEEYIQEYMKICHGGSQNPYPEEI